MAGQVGSGITLEAEKPNAGKLRKACWVSSDLEELRALSTSPNDPDEWEVGGLNRAPLAVAAARGELAFVELLLEQGASAEAEDTRGDRALAAAVVCGHAAVVKALLAGGSDRTAKNKKGWSAGQLAAVYAGVDASGEILALLSE